MRLAIIEEKMALVYLLRKFRILDTPATGVSGALECGIFI